MELSLFQMKNKLKRLKKKSTVSLSCIHFSPSMYMYSLYMYFNNFLGEGYDLAFHFSGSNYFCPGAFKPYFLLCASECEATTDPPCSKTIGFYYPTKLISWSRKKLAFYQSIKTLFPLSTDSFYAQVSDSCREIFAYCT